MADNDPLQIEPSVFDENIFKEIGKIGPESKTKPIQFHPDVVSALNLCKTDQATLLCILDLAKKLKHSDHYDIGGTYSINETQRAPEFWFYYTTSNLYFNKYILNIFLCHRNIGTFKIGISKINMLNKKSVETTDSIITYLSLPDTLSWKTFKSCQLDQSHHILSLCFSKEDLTIFQGKALCIPIKIDVYQTFTLPEELLIETKMVHDLYKPFKRKEKYDFTIKSSSGMTYDTHKLILAAYSPVLRHIIKNSKSNNADLAIDDVDMDLLLEFLYTNSIENMTEIKFPQILELANKFKIDDLINQVGQAITEQVTIENAMDMAVLTEKYRLYDVQNTIFQFIKNNQEVIQTESWKKFNDAALTKKLFEVVYINTKSK